MTGSSISWRGIAIEPHRRCSGPTARWGETWTLLGTKLIQSGLYRAVVLIPAAVGGSSVHRWADGGDLNATMVAEIRAA